MPTKEIDGISFKNLILGGLVALKNNCQSINDLNVFPVPDGDTGSNMKMTLEGGVKEIVNFNSDNVYEVSKKLARGMLLGARGNSGVILSQIFKGISNGLEGFEKADVNVIVNAFGEGVKQGYKAVVKPVEGTILTVVREATEVIQKSKDSFSDIEELFDKLIESAKISLKNTPNLLPVLKEAGVIDSGGAGLIYIFEGMYSALTGKELVEEISSTIDESSAVSRGSFNADSELEYGYCTEFILQLMNKKVDIPTFDVQTIVKELEAIGGNSIVAIKDEDVVKVHVHTFTPGEVFNIAQKYGEFITLKVENMSIQHSESSLADSDIKTTPTERKRVAVVTVAGSDGFKEVFSELGADYVVFGGQTMNPSSEAFLNAFKEVNAENIIVLPNNGNIILTAKQAKDLFPSSNVEVIASKSLAQGYSALTMYNPDDDFESVVGDMTSAIENVTSVSVTSSIRDAEIDGVTIKKDEHISIVDGKIVASNVNRLETLKQTFKKIKNIEYKEVVTLFYGKDVSSLELSDFISFIHSEYPSLEVGEIEGGQEVYSYILSIE